MSGIYGHIVHTKSSFTFADMYFVFFLFGVQVSAFFLYAVIDLKKQDKIMEMYNEAQELFIEAVHNLSDYFKKTSVGNESKVGENVVQGKEGSIDEAAYEDEKNKQNTPATSVSSSTSSVDTLNAMPTSKEVSTLQSELTALEDDNKALKKKVKALEEEVAGAAMEKKKKKKKKDSGDVKDDNSTGNTPQVGKAESTDSWFFSSSPTATATDAASNEEDKKKIGELEATVKALEKKVKKLKAALDESSMALEAKEKDVTAAAVAEKTSQNQVDLMKSNKELNFKNDQLKVQVTQLQAKIKKFEDEITSEKGSNDTSTPDKIYRLIEVYKDEIHEMHDTYAQQSYELFSVKDELATLKAEGGNKNKDKNKLVTTTASIQGEEIAQTASKDKYIDGTKTETSASKIEENGGWFGWNTPPATPDRPPVDSEEKDPTITTLKNTSSGSNTATNVDVKSPTTREPSSPAIKPSRTPGRFRELALASEPVKAVAKTNLDPAALTKIKSQSKAIQMVETAQVKKACMLLQRMIRGKRGRDTYKRKLEEVPHAMVVAVEGVTDILLNDDVFSSLPDTYILANIIKKKESSKKSYIFSSKATAVAYQSTNPTFNEDLKLISSGPGTLVLSVMSAHTMTADTFLGQASIDLEDYHNLSNGERHHFSLPLSEITHPMYDKMGTIKIIENRTGISGKISFTVDTPPISENIAGWWFEIATDMFGTLSNQKMWVVLRGQEMLCYDSNFENSLISILKLSEIAKIIETECTETEIAMRGLKIDFNDSTVASRTWCYGTDDKKTKGLWIHALRKYIRQ